MADLVVELSAMVDEWLATEPGCVACEPLSTQMAAIDIAVDGDQVAECCYGCGRLVRSFSCHDDDGHPSAYVGRADEFGRAVTAAAWYRCGSGRVGSVPAVDPACPTRTIWRSYLASDELARAVLAHLVGLDVPDFVWAEFDTDIVSPLLRSAVGGEWELATDEVLDWLAANR